MKKKKSKPPNYLADLVRMHREGHTRPGLFIADIYHDDGCAHWRGGACNCNPDIITTPAQEWIEKREKRA